MRGLARAQARRDRSSPHLAPSISAPRRRHGACNSWAPRGHDGRPLKTPHRLPPTHVPALDGLRGIAILSVLLFHLSWVLSPTHTTTHAAREVVLAGWVGVDLFFVLSGTL